MVGAENRQHAQNTIETTLTKGERENKTIFTGGMQMRDRYSQHYHFTH
jgi:hypothetical protein